MNEFLKSLTSTPGLSGREIPIAELIMEKWTPLVDRISRSRLGSVHGLKNGAVEGRRPSVMIATHMDSIGLMVSRVVQGFLYITNIGDIDPRILPGAQVTVHGTGIIGDLSGVIVMPPANLLPQEKPGQVVPMNHLLVDLGLSPAEVKRRVNIGDLVTFDTEPVELAGGWLTAPALDNRASVAALTVCLEALQARSHAWDLWAVATVQEELSYAGAYTSVFQLRPSIAISVDMTYGRGQAADDYREFPIGEGVTLGIGPSIHPFLHRRFREVAERMEIPVHDEAMPEHSLTDADAMQITSEGIPTMVLSIPVRYMHTPVEMVALKDVQRAGHLLAEFTATLEVDFLDRITWDD